MTDVPHSHSHSHTLDDVVGYEVRHTIVDGVKLGKDGPIVERVNDPHQYLAALQAAVALRDLPDSYALVDSVFSCGCTDNTIQVYGR